LRGVVLLALAALVVVVVLGRHDMCESRETGK
jgi:hypothetical protein